jgi:signal transduction histidine kinase/ActR/RegA family two-component response regulator
MERGQTGYIDDVSLRPDLVVPGTGEAGGFRSLIATPFRLGGRIVGAVEAYSRSPRKWTVDDFKVIEWLSHQASLVLETLDLQRQLDRRRREAEDASMRKTRFLAAVSHDVRTPANAINLLAELTVRAGECPSRVDEVPELARELKANAAALVELVSDVLDVARFDTGRLELEISTFSLSALVNREVNQLRAVAAAKGLSLSLEKPTDAEPVHLRTDRMKLSRVVTNIVANAIKFTQDGGVTVLCRPLPTGHVEIAVSDTGVGIPVDTQPHIFDEFFQMTNPARDRTKGTGLGLAICKRLADAIGCTLTVDSTPGTGTTFTITIPPALVASPAPDAPTVTVPHPAGPTGAAPRPLTGLQILLVEDHHPTRRATARLLASAGATVIQAETGTAAIHLLRHESPHVLLLDLMLPDIDGSEVLKSLRTRRPESLRTIFAVSGDCTDRRAEQVKALGADGLIPKPVNIHTLVQRLASAAAGEREAQLVS